MTWLLASVISTCWLNACLQSKYFKHFMCAVIAVNCGMMGLDQFDAAQWRKDMANYLYWVCMCCFITEMVIRCARCGTLHHFWKSHFNRLEIVLTSLSLIGLAWNIPALKQLPSFRLYRWFLFACSLYCACVSAQFKGLVAIRWIVHVISYNRLLLRMHKYWGVRSMTALYSIALAIWCTCLRAYTHESCVLDN